MKKIQRKHETHRLTYAIANDRRLVNIDKVKNGLECCCICPACKEPLVAKNQGKARIHHFAHQSGTECDWAHESMLHLLAKERVQSAFLDTEYFRLDFECRSYCPNEKQCMYVKCGHCYEKTRKNFNLKDYYDSCEQEVTYDGIKRRSDLKLFSSTTPNRHPIYIEFCVTHASDQEKLHSGNKIIECIIEDESDIEEIIKNGFVEGIYNGDEYGQEPQARVQFYGFTKVDYNNNHLNTEIVYSRYVLFKSGKTRCYQERCRCKEIKKSSPYSLYEVCFHTRIAFGIREFAKYLGYDKFHIPNCLLCKNYKSYYGTRGICTLYKHLLIPEYNLDTSKAKNCHCYTFNQEEYDQLKQGGCNVPFDEI